MRLEISVLGGGIAEMETDIENPQLKETDWKKTSPELIPFQPLSWSIRKRNGSACG